MTQCMVHCVQFLHTIFIFNPFMSQGVEILPALCSSCPYFNLHTGHVYTMRHTMSNYERLEKRVTVLERGNRNQQRTLDSHISSIANLQGRTLGGGGAGAWERGAGNGGGGGRGNGGGAQRE